MAGALPDGFETAPGSVPGLKIENNKQNRLPWPVCFKFSYRLYQVSAHDGVNFASSANVLSMGAQLPVWCGGPSLVPPASAEEIEEELNKVMEDGLVRFVQRLGAKGAKKGEEQELYKLPKETVSGLGVVAGSDVRVGARAEVGLGPGLNR